MSLRPLTRWRLDMERLRWYNRRGDEVNAQWVHRRVSEPYMNKRRLATWRSRWLSYMAGR